MTLWVCVRRETFQLHLNFQVFWREVVRHILLLSL